MNQNILKAQEEAEELPESNGEYTKIHFEGGEKVCGVLNGVSPKVSGSQTIAIVSPKGLGEWTQTQRLDIEGPAALQHDWLFWRSKGIGMKTGLHFNGETAEHKGEYEEKTPNQEVARFEE